MAKNNGNPACASCKHQRKKCTEKCILAPLFPASKNREFQAVHKFFGVSNVTKIVKNLREEDRMRAVNSLVWEAVCRQRDPVLGPYAEYARIYEELQLYKSFQLSTQGGMVYKPKPKFGGWNNSNNKSVGVLNCDNNGTYKYINGNGYNSMITDYQMGQENDAGSVVLSSPQQNSINEFNYHYYLPDEKYYTSSVIKCKDGSSSFTKDRLNDNFCDCVDGTDEPGTAACPNGKFYYCCDGSDEYASGAICPNTCVMGGNVAYKRISYGLTNDLDFTGVNVIEKEVVTEDSNQKISGLNIAIVLQAIVLSLVVALWLFYRRVRVRRR